MTRFLRTACLLLAAVSLSSRELAGVQAASSTPIASDSADFASRAFAAHQHGDPTPTTPEHDIAQSSPSRCPQSLMSELRRAIAEPCFALPPHGSPSQWRRCTTRRREQQHQLLLCLAPPCDLSATAVESGDANPSHHDLLPSSEQSEHSSPSAEVSDASPPTESIILQDLSAMLPISAAEADACARFAIRFCRQSPCLEQRPCECLPDERLPGAGECSPEKPLGNSFDASYSRRACDNDAVSLLAIRYREDQCQPQSVCRAFHVSRMSRALFEHDLKARCELFAQHDVMRAPATVDLDFDFQAAAVRHSTTAFNLVNRPREEDFAQPDDFMANTALESK